VENLELLVSTLFSLPLAGTQILVVDDNSPDGTGELAERLHRTYPERLSVLHRPEKAGLGTAYVQGFRLALDKGAEAVVQMDADFSHPPEKLIEMAEALQCCDLVLGSRYVPGGCVDERWPIWRKGLSAFGNLYARTILRIPIRDVTGGFRIWRGDSLRKMPLDQVKSNGYAFQVEMAHLATCMGYKLVEIPIYFADRRWGRSKMSFKIQREAAIRVWQILFEYRNVKC
jgi:dolichol-phosphate mannosyltransferase